MVTGIALSNNPDEQDRPIWLRFCTPHGEIYASVESKLYGDWVKVGFSACDPHDRGLKKVRKREIGRGRSGKRLRDNPISIPLTAPFEFSGDTKKDKEKFFNLLEHSVMVYLVSAAESPDPTKYLGLKPYHNFFGGSFIAWFRTFGVELKKRLDGKVS